MRVRDLDADGAIAWFPHAAEHIAADVDGCFSRRFWTTVFCRTVLLCWCYDAVALLNEQGSCGAPREVNCAGAGLVEPGDAQRSVRRGGARPARVAWSSARRG